MLVKKIIGNDLLDDKRNLTKNKVIKREESRGGVSKAKQSIRKNRAIRLRTKHLALSQLGINLLEELKTIDDKTRSKPTEKQQRKHKNLNQRVKEAAEKTNSKHKASTPQAKLRQIGRVAQKPLVKVISTQANIFLTLNLKTSHRVRYRQLINYKILVKVV